MSELKPCPFCGGTKICTEKSINLNYCDNCSAESNIEHWNTRPIEDALNKRIAELEAEIDIRKDQLREAKNILIDKKLHIPALYEEGYKLQQRIAELERDVKWREESISTIEHALDNNENDIEMLESRITELEAENIRLGIEYQRMRLALGNIAINSKRALNESPTDQLTAHSDIERQDDKWIPVSERLPETDGQYIGYTNTGLVGTHWLVDGHFVVTYSCEQNWLTTPTSWILESASGGDVYVTHWMPLPEPPKECEKNG